MQIFEASSASCLPCSLGSCLSICSAFGVRPQTHLIYPWKSCGSTKRNQRRILFIFNTSHKTHFAFISFRKSVRSGGQEKIKKKINEMKMMKMQLIPDGLRLLCQPLVPHSMLLLSTPLPLSTIRFPSFACVFCYNFYFIFSRHLKPNQPEAEAEAQWEPESASDSASESGQRLTFNVAQLYII